MCSGIVAKTSSFTHKQIPTQARAIGKKIHRLLEKYQKTIKKKNILLDFFPPIRRIHYVVVLRHDRLAKNFKCRYGIFDFRNLADNAVIFALLRVQYWGFR